MRHPDLLRSLALLGLGAWVVTARLTGGPGLRPLVSWITLLLLLAATLLPLGMRLRALRAQRRAPADEPDLPTTPHRPAASESECVDVLAVEPRVARIGHVAIDILLPFLAIVAWVETHHREPLLELRPDRDLRCVIAPCGG